MQERYLKESERGFCLTVEHGLYLLILTAAAVMRLANLGTVPLSPIEAQEALAVWQFWQPASLVDAPLLPGSPAYFSLTSLLSQAVGISDAIMRLIPALFGLGLILLPWWLRNQIGRIGALTASLLFAFSPVHSIASRTAGGETIALFAALLLLIAWLHYQESGRQRWFYLFMGALALGLVSAPIFYGLLLALLLAWLAHVVIGPAIFENEEGEARPLTWPEPPIRRRAFLTGTAVFLGLGGFFLWYPDGLGAAANLPATWLGHFALPNDLMVWMAPLVALSRYEPILVVIGGAAVVWATWRGDPLPNFLVFWLTGALLLIFVQQGQVSNILLLSLPGYLLVGALTDHIFSEEAGWEKWALFGLLLFLGTVIFVNLNRYGRTSLHNPDLLTHAWMAVLALAIALIAVNLVAFRSGAAAKQGVITALLVCLLIYGWGTAWRLGHYAANDPRERWVGEAADDEVRLLATTIRHFSRLFTNSDYDLAIFTAVDSPVLRWYLRDYPNLEIGHTLPQGANQHILITYEQDEAAPGSAYIGSAFALVRPETVHLLNTNQSLRWWFFYESPVAIPKEKVILWLRADLAGIEGN